jgi:hypothetical protein
MKKEIALIPKITQALKEVMAASGSTLPLPSGIDVLSEKLAKALTETYDSKEDPIVLAYIATTVAIGSDPLTGQVAIPAGTSYIFTHNLGFIPHVTVVRSAGALWWGITSLTATTVTIYSDHPYLCINEIRRTLLSI